MTIRWGNPSVDVMISKSWRNWVTVISDSDLGNLSSRFRLIRLKNTEIIYLLYYCFILFFIKLSRW